MRRSIICIASFFPSWIKRGSTSWITTKLTKTQKEKVDTYFQEVVHPVLTPLALDPGHPFPHISNLSLNLAIVIRDPKGNEKFARLKVPEYAGAAGADQTLVGGDAQRRHDPASTITSSGSNN